MKKSLIILGNTHFAEMIKIYVEQYRKISVSAFSVDSYFIREKVLVGIPVIPLENLTDQFAPEETEIIIAIGYSQMNKVRKEKINYIKEKGYFLPNFIHPSVHIENAELGEGNIILENCNLGYHSKIGNGNILWNGCNISHDCVIGDNNYLSPSVALAGRTVIEDNCFLGINSCTGHDVYIKKYTLIGAGCFMNSSTEEYDVYVSQKPTKLRKKSLDINI